MGDSCDLLCIDLPVAEMARGNLPSPPALASASGRAKAFADPTRLAIAAALHMSFELCVCDLSWIVAKPQNLVSHHLGKLRAQGLAQSRRDGKIVFYALTEDGRSTLAALLPDAIGVSQ